MTGRQAQTTTNRRLHGGSARPDSPINPLAVRCTHLRVAADTTGVHAERDDALERNNVVQVLDGSLQVHVAHSGGDLAAVLVVHAQVGAPGLDSCKQTKRTKKHTTQAESQSTSNYVCLFSRQQQTGSKPMCHSQ